MLAALWALRGLSLLGKLHRTPALYITFGVLDLGSWHRSSCGVWHNRQMWKPTAMTWRIVNCEYMVQALHALTFFSPRIFKSTIIVVQTPTPAACTQCIQYGNLSYSYCQLSTKGGSVHTVCLTFHPVLSSVFKALWYLCTHLQWRVCY